MNKIVLLTACLLCLATSNVYANSELTVAPGIMKFDYTERDTDGSFFDGEYGYIPGVEIDFRKDQPNGSVLGFSFGYYNGAVDYDGAIQSQDDPNLDGLPFKSDTNQAVTTFMGYFSKPMTNSDTDLHFYGTFSYKTWERDIQGKTISGIGTQGIPFQNEIVPDLFETYRWWQFSLGLKYHLNLSPNSGLQINAGVLRTLNPQMEVDVGPFITNVASYIATYNLKAKWGYETGVSWLTRISSTSQLGVSGTYTYWEFGRSNAAFGFLEPDSESKMATVKLTYQMDL